MMITQIAIVVFSLVVVPLALLFYLWRSRSETQLDWLVKTAAVGAFIVFTMLAGRWDWLSVYVRWALPLLYVLAAALAFAKVRTQPFLPRQKGRGWLEIVGNGVTLLIFGALAGFEIVGLQPGSETVRMAMPLGAGQYYVAHGGANTLLNYHSVSASQRYAVDVVGLNSIGARASGLYPTELDAYAIYSAPIVSPCDGAVLTTVDGLPEQAILATDRDNPAGNHIVLACQGVSVEIAHMRTGSVAVQPGQAITTGQPLGRAGNSGNTSEPHLHIHAVAGESPDGRGEGVPIAFEAGFLSRNAIVTVPPG